MPSYTEASLDQWLSLRATLNISYIDPNNDHVWLGRILQISYSLVVILELSSFPEVQYKEVMTIGNE